MAAFTKFTAPFKEEGQKYAYVLFFQTEPGYFDWLTTKALYDHGPEAFLGQF